MKKEKDKNSKNTEDEQIFENDTNLQSAYLAQKCKRLSSALYAVTRFFDDEEPLRKKLRSNSLRLVQLANTPQGSNSGIGVNHILKQIRDQLQIARDGGLLSSMNYHVLEQEISKLTKELNNDKVSIGLRLNEGYVSASGTSERPVADHRNKSAADSSKKTDKDASNASRQAAKPRSAKARRRQRILDLFTDTDEITINDVTEVITGFSKKTLQRDLKALVQAGKLEKHGKRRWSSYTKVDN